MIFILFTLVSILSLVQADSYYLQQYSLPTGCDLAFNEEISVLHCKHIASIIQKGVPSYELTFDSPIENPRTFLEAKGLIYLLRDHEIVIIDPQFEYQEVQSLPKISLHPHKIDLQTDFIIADDYLFFKQKGACQLKKLDLNPDEDFEMIEIVVDLKTELSDCVLNFTVYKSEGSLKVIAYVKELSMIVNMTYSDTDITEKSYIVSPEVWVTQFDKQQINSNEGLVILTTLNEFSQEICHYLFMENELHFHFEEVLDCTAIKEWKDIRVYFVNREEFFIVGDKIVRYKKESELKKTIKWTAEYLAEEHGFISKEEKDMNFLQNEVKNRKTLEIKIEEEGICNSEDICLRKHEEIRTEDEKANQQICFDLKASSLKDPKIPSITAKLFKNRNCESTCTQNTNSESCIECITNLFKSLTKADCLHQENIIALLDSQFYPKVIEKKCDFTMEKSNADSLIIRLQPKKFGYHCTFVWDLGVLKYLVSEISPISEGSLSLNFYEDIKSIPKRHQIIDQNMILEENVKFLGINFENLDKPMTLKLHTGTFYLHSMICFDYCIKCLIDGWSEPNFHFNEFYGRKPSYKNEWASHSCFNSKVQPLPNSKNHPTQNWYQCFAQNETYSENLAVCQIKYDSSGNRIFISFNKEKGNFPFCKTSLRLSSLASLEVELDSHEDVAIRIADEYVSIRTLPYERGYELAKIHKLAHTLAEVELYYINLNSPDRFPDSRVIEVSYDVSKNYTGQIVEILKKSVVIGLVIGIAIIIIKLCKCNNIFSLDRIRKMSQVCPYQLADFIIGNPKEVRLNSQQMEELTKAGFSFNHEKKPVDIEDDCDCFICLRPLKEQDYRIFLCGVHFTHVKCFKQWIKGREANNFSYLCPLRCVEIAMSDSNDEFMEDTLFEFDDDDEATNQKGESESPRDPNKPEAPETEANHNVQKTNKMKKVEQTRKNIDQEMARAVAEALGEDYEENRDFSRNTSEGIPFAK